MQKTFHFAERKFTVDVDRNKIESISVFGSHIYGDADEKSDIDILVIVANMPDSQKKLTRVRIAKELQVPYSWISIHTKKDLADFCKAGDYYFWCLKLTRISMYERTDYTKKTFDKIAIYTKVRKNLYAYKSEIAEFMNKFHKQINSQEKTINLLAHYTRKLFIEMAYMNGFVLFDKVKPIQTCFSLPDVHITFSYQEYEELVVLKREYKSNSKFKLSENRKEYIMMWHRYLKNLHREALRIEKIKMGPSFKSPLLSYVKK